MELPSKEDFRDFMESKENVMPGVLERISSDALATSLANGESESNLNGFKMQTNTINSELSSYNDKLGHILGNVERENTALAAKLKVNKAETAEMVKSLGKEKELVELRKEQATELKTKYGANFHTSWLGLWKPLQPETHAILFTISIFLALSSILGIAYLIYTRVTFPAFPSSGSTSTSGTSLLEGGARLFRKK